MNKEMIETFHFWSIRSDLLASKATLSSKGNAFYKKKASKQRSSGTFLLQTAFAQVFDSVLLRIHSKADGRVNGVLLLSTLSLFSKRKISKRMMLSRISNGS